MDHKLAALRVCKAVKLGKLFRISLRHFGLCVGRLIIYLWLLPLCDLFQVYRARCFLCSFYASWAELWLIAASQVGKGEALKGFTQMFHRQFSSDYKELRFKRSLLSNYQCNQCCSCLSMDISNFNLGIQFGIRICPLSFVTLINDGETEASCQLWHLHSQTQKL